MAETQPSELLLALAPEQETAAEPVAEPETDEAAAAPAEQAVDTGSLIEPTKEPAAEGPVKLKDLAESSKVDLKAIYAAELSNGMTVGELKDKAGSFESLETDRETFEADRNSFNVDRAATLAHLEEVAALVKAGRADAETFQKLEQFKATTMQAEQAALLRVIPEWKDQTAKTADVQDMVSYVSRFGISQQMLAAVTNHQLLNFVHFHTRQAARTKSVLSDAPKKLPKGSRKGKQALPSRSVKSTAGASPELQAALTVLQGAKK